MKNSGDLKNLLIAINRKGYPAYKETRGSYQFGEYIFSVDHVQGDPFAAPSKVHVLVPGKKAGFPEVLFDRDCKRIALQDQLLRRFHRELDQYNFQAKGSGKSGLMSVSRPGQEVLERTACKVDPKTGDVTMRMEIGFPANGRTINSGELIKILFDFLPVCVKKTLYYGSYSSQEKQKVRQVTELAEDQQYIRDQLEKLGLCAFVANGSVLPRESGISARPMKQGIPFVSPKQLEVTMELPHHGTLTGMGIRKGITLIVGGGYHGKSTLLKALELGVYNHIAGDGREYVITDASAMKLRAEDGRSICKTDISMFINNLPNGKDTRAFSTEDASGSTSQAANVIEAMETGTTLFLIDEDTCATNFMIRDELMQRVVHRSQEPITPFIERVRGLYSQQGISCILVAGSSGAYFHVADCIIQMDRYVPREITALAKAEAKAFPLVGLTENLPEIPDYQRFPVAGKDLYSSSQMSVNNAGREIHSTGRENYRDGGIKDRNYRGRNRKDGTGQYRNQREETDDMDVVFDSRGRDRVKLKTLGKDAFSINRDTVDLRYVEQLVDSEQTTALSHLVKYAEQHLCDGRRTLQEVVGQLEKLLKEKGLEGLCDGSYPGANMAMPRTQEIYAAFNRYRTQTWR